MIARRRSIQQGLKKIKKKKGGGQQKRAPSYRPGLRGGGREVAQELPEGPLAAWVVPERFHRGGHRVEARGPAVGPEAPHHAAHEVLERGRRQGRQVEKHLAQAAEHGRGNEPVACAAALAGQGREQRQELLHEREGDVHLAWKREGAAHGRKGNGTLGVTRAPGAKRRVPTQPTSCYTKGGRGPYQAGPREASMVQPRLRARSLHDTCSASPSSSSALSSARLPGCPATSVAR